ncbi:putative transposase [Saccharothrix tamanrassetensis]|uniref:Putative transposase n=1 Tax=Saccharothrix tamanrassetensis TaxID=1051531 RepID=A0A841CRX9_9PSEU|nr:PucR family transcriptional regulator [Saccharothrix tamanrassetensis]MBB5960501.1 putative transposase [Saccharothrix tamanrassetensis]
MTIRACSTSWESASGRVVGWSGGAVRPAVLTVSCDEETDRAVCGALEAQLAGVAGQLLLRSEELVAAQLRVVGAIGSYRAVPPSEVRPSAHRNVVRVVAALRGAEHPAAGAVEEDEQETGRRRALQGIPSADVLVAYQRGIALLRDEFLRAARAEGLPADAALLGVQRIWQVGDRYSNDILAGHRKTGFDLVHREGQHRRMLLTRLLEGTMTTEQVVTAGVGLGLAADRDYWVLRARSAGSDPVTLTRVLERAVGAQDTVLIGDYRGDAAAVLSRPVADEPAGDITVGLAGPAVLSRLGVAFAEATRLLEAAIRFGRGGVVDRGRMALRLAVADERELGEYLHARYVELVSAESATGEALLASVETYLSRRRSIPEAAAALSVHVNTLRYRLARFAALTGADLQDTETAFEVWWALQYRNLCESPM